MHNVWDDMKFNFQGDVYDDINNGIHIVWMSDQIHSIDPITNYY